MSAIIAGRFDEQARAEQARSALEASGFIRQHIATFFVNPPGQHDLRGTTLDPDASAGAHHAGAGSMAGAATGSGVGAMIGLATAPVTGPGGALIGAAIGAYVGSFAGALDNLDNPEQACGESTVCDPGRDEALPRKGGVLVAIGTRTSEDEATATAVLRAQGAVDIERAEGTIVQSRWTDFDPLAMLRLVPRSGSERLPHVSGVVLT